MVGPSGLEPPTLRLSVVRSNQLSYGPSSSRTSFRSFPAEAESAFTPLQLLSKLNPLHWASIWFQAKGGGDSRDRTGDLLLARQALSQLSYIPTSSRTSYPLLPTKVESAVTPSLLLPGPNPLCWALARLLGIPGNRACSRRFRPFPQACFCGLRPLNQTT